MVAAFMMVVFVGRSRPAVLAGSFLVALVGMALLGAMFNLAVYYPLRHRTFLPVIISTIGASIFMANTACSRYTGRSHRSWLGLVRDVRASWSDRSTWTAQYLLIMVVTAAAGRAAILVLRAHAARQEAAGDLPGQGDGLSPGHPRVSAMIMITFVYSAVIGGIAGILVAPILFVSIQMGSTIALKAFAATIIGGFGDVAGAIIGGSGARRHRDVRGRLRVGALQGRIRVSGAGRYSWSFARRAFSANGWPRRHELRPSGCAVRKTRRPRPASRACRPTVAARRPPRWLCRGPRADQRLRPQYPDAGRRPSRSRCSGSPSCSACAGRSISPRRRSSGSVPMRSGSEPPCMAAELLGFRWSIGLVLATVAWARCSGPRPFGLAAIISRW